MAAYESALPALEGVKARNGCYRLRRRLSRTGMPLSVGEAVPEGLHCDKEAADTTEGEGVGDH